MRFSATIQLDGKTATGITVPDDVVAALGGGNRPRVRVTLAGYTYQTTVARMHGTFKFPVSAAVRDRLGSRPTTSSTSRLNSTPRRAT